MSRAGVGSSIQRALSACQRMLWCGLRAVRACRAEVDIRLIIGPRPGAWQAAACKLMRACGLRLARKRGGVGGDAYVYITTPQQIFTFPRFFRSLATLKHMHRMSLRSPTWADLVALAHGPAIAAEFAHYCAGEPVKPLLQKRLSTEAS